MCLLDLDYNLPVQVRDSATGKELEDLPESDVNKEYVLQRLAEDGDLDSSYNKQRADDTILKLQRTTPYYKVSQVAQYLVVHCRPVVKMFLDSMQIVQHIAACSCVLQRNRAPICSFFVKGECKRGAECPYRHEMPSTGELAEQNIKDR